MNSTNEEMRELLAEIKAFRSDVVSTAKQFDERITKCENALEKERRKRQSKDDKVQAQLKELFESVNELAKTPIWRDESDGRVAINRKKTYARFKSLGVSPRDALNALAEEGWLIRDSEGKNTRTVRTPRGIERAVMINSYGHISIS
jgi:hypothetical protein